MSRTKPHGASRDAEAEPPRNGDARAKKGERGFRIGSWWPLALALLLTILLAPKLVGPACPRRIVMSTGSPGGAYHRYAQMYRDELAKNGIELALAPSSGATENLRRLRNDEQGVSLAFFQGGAVEDPTQISDVESLGSVYLEPLWLFYRETRETNHLTDLRGRRIAVGAPGSGTQSLVRKLLAANDVAPERGLWKELGAVAAAKALVAGEVEAAFFVTAVDSPVVDKLAATPGIGLLAFERAPAYETKFRMLAGVTLPRGAISLANHLPAEDVTLLAPTASVIARQDLHPAIVPLMMKAMEAAHGDGETLSKPGDFPSTHRVSFAMRPMAKQYIQHGPSFLYRVLPFWLAAWIDRTKLLLLPMITVLLPALKVAPPIYVWRIRRRIYRWYGAVREIDEQVRSGKVANPRQALRQLHKVERAITDVAVPMGYMEEFFNLRLTIDDVRSRLNKLTDSNNATEPLPGSPHKGRRAA